MKLTLPLVTLALSAYALAMPTYSLSDKRALGIQCLKDPANPSKCLSTGTPSNMPTMPVRSKSRQGWSNGVKKRSPVPIMSPELVAQRCAANPSSVLCRYITSTAAPEGGNKRRNPAPIMSPELVAQRCAAKPSSTLCRYLTGWRSASGTAA
jgi:hypothetical protein